MLIHGYWLFFPLMGKYGGFFHSAGESSCPVSNFLDGYLRDVVEFCGYLYLWLKGLVSIFCVFL